MNYTNKSVITIIFLINKFNNIVLNQRKKTNHDKSQLVFARSWLYSITKPFISPLIFR